jgi:hypothetical protein
LSFPSSPWWSRAPGTALAAKLYLITSSKQIKPGAIALGN